MLTAALRPGARPYAAPMSPRGPASLLRINPRVARLVDSLTGDTVDHGDFSRPLGLSLGDRACIALAEELAAPALTADRSWLRLDVDVEIRVIR